MAELYFKLLYSIPISSQKLVKAIKNMIWGEGTGEETGRGHKVNVNKPQMKRETKMPPSQILVF